MVLVQLLVPSVLLVPILLCKPHPLALRVPLAPTTLVQGPRSVHPVQRVPTLLALEPLPLPAASHVSLVRTPLPLGPQRFAPSAALAPTTLALGPRCAQLVQWGPTV